MVQPLPKSTVSYTRLYRAAPSHLRSISKDEDGQSPTASLDTFFRHFTIFMVRKITKIFHISNWNFLWFKPVPVISCTTPVNPSKSSVFLTLYYKVVEDMNKLSSLL